MDETWPPYAFVPGGPFPHPGGHGEDVPAPPPIEGGGWGRSPLYLRGVALFNEGYYWEAHEAWESLWHAHGRAGPVADLLKGLIKLAAAGVKVRQRQPHGIVTHAARAAALFASVRRIEGPSLLGLDLGELETLARRVAEDPPTVQVPIGERVATVFDFRLAPR